MSDRLINTVQMATLAAVTHELGPTVNGLVVAIRKTASVARRLSSAASPAVRVDDAVRLAHVAAAAG